MSEVDETNMSPDASPGEIKKVGTRRVNNWPMYLVGIGLGIFILIMVLVAKDRADKQHQERAATKAGGGNSEMFANGVIGNSRNGIVPATRPVIPASSTTVASANSNGPVIQVAHPDLDRPPSPPSNPQQDNERSQIEQGKFQQFMEAVHAKTTVAAEGYRSPGSVPGGKAESAMTPSDLNAKLEAVRQEIAAKRLTDPTAAFKEQLALIKNSGLIPSSAAGSSAPSLAGTGNGSASGNASGNGGNNDVSQFGGDAKNRWNLNASVEAPSTPYELRAGAVLPATLISGINSELPGQIMAQISQNVFDTATGKQLLIPQGSRLVGTYASNVAYGQSRVLVAWQRIVFPDGKALDIGAMPGADAAGYAGYHDKVNNHFFRIFGSALLMSGITAGVAYSQDRNEQVSSTGYSVPSASQEMSQALGQQLGMATAQMIEKNLNISPTIEIRPGYRFNVIATKDIALTKPYQSFDY